MVTRKGIERLRPGDSEPTTPRCRDCRSHHLARRAREERRLHHCSPEDTQDFEAYVLLQGGTRIGRIHKVEEGDRGWADDVMNAVQDARSCAENAIPGELLVCIHDCGLQHRLNDGFIDRTEANRDVKTGAADLRVEHLLGQLRNGPFVGVDDGAESNVNCGEDYFVLEAEAIVERQDVVDNALTELLQEILGICVPVLLGCRDAELVLVHRCVGYASSGLSHSTLVSIKQVIGMRAASIEAGLRAELGKPPVHVIALSGILAGAGGGLEWCAYLGAGCAPVKQIGVDVGDAEKGDGLVIAFGGSAVLSTSSDKWAGFNPSAHNPTWPPVDARTPLEICSFRPEVVCLAAQTHQTLMEGGLAAFTGRKYDGKQVSSIPSLQTTFESSGLGSANQVLCMAYDPDRDCTLATNPPGDTASTNLQAEPYNTWSPRSRLVIYNPCSPRPPELRVAEFKIFEVAVTDKVRRATELCHL
ncbi:uncharacterized protein B0I36DRAFT_432506 [Microdochium trichocladiopsis]|uniref:Uncharacterized protein n=1 Tax=Microdochium trichocladiopsis TaxID=1682393 RepID=A0A9P9BN97_9PEZI|nr:uncharacterized protein B0I36DRAFT_432506 [Microdochium trichocladiopsis]KAH7027159.1 hypothetical protein B0I36DRAFT_432506 [Microdochium trichocladiopsis]